MDVVIALLCAVVGIALCLIGGAGAAIMGAIMIALGVFLFLILKSRFKIEGDPTPYKRETIDLPSSRKESVIDFLSGKKDDLDTTKGAGTGLILYLYTSPEQADGYCDLYEYAQYEYKDCTGIVKVNAKQIERLHGHKK